MNQDLAAAWARYSCEREKATFNTANLLICTLMPAWSLFDYLVEPSVTWRFLGVRIADSIFAVVVWLFIARSTDTGRNRVAMFFSVVAVGVAIAWMLPQVPNSYMLYVLGFSLVFWGCGLLLLWPLPWVIASFGTILGVHVALQLGAPAAVPRRELFGTLFYLVSVALIAGAQLVVRRRLEYHAFRASFTLEQQNAELAGALQALEETQTRLSATRIASTDSLDLDAIARQTTGLAVPSFASWAVMIVLGPDERWVAYVQHPDPAVSARVEGALSGAEPTLIERAARLTGVTEADIAGLLGPDAADVLRAASLLVAPLTARGQRTGVLVFGRRDHDYSRSDIVWVEEVAHRTALALDNARLLHEATEAVRVRDEFLSVASHELRTPLTPLRLTMDALSRACGAEDVRMRAALARADRQVARLTALIEQLLDVTRLAEGRLEMHREEMDMGEAVREVAARFGAGGDGAGSTIEVISDGQVTGWWDRSRVDQVLTNLVSNAVKYGRGRPIRMSWSRGPASVAVRVEDQGIGIHERDHARIFQRFERAVSVHSYGGLGLGLWIAQSMVESMGGTIRVESEPGHGATFVVDLPIGGRPPEDSQEHSQATLPPSRR